MPSAQQVLGPVSEDNLRGLIGLLIGISMKEKSLTTWEGGSRNNISQKINVSTQLKWTYM